MHKTDQKLKLLIFSLSFDLAKGEGGTSAPLAPPGCALVYRYNNNMWPWLAFETIF